MADLKQSELFPADTQPTIYVGRAISTTKLVLE